MRCDDKGEVVGEEVEGVGMGLGGRRRRGKDCRHPARDRVWMPSVNGELQRGGREVERKREGRVRGVEEEVKTARGGVAYTRGPPSLPHL
jgi:hypothetical protein